MSTKVSQLTSGSSLTGPETLYIVQSGNSRKIPVSNILSDSLFTQTGTGATARSINTRFNEVISVKDFGAKMDGVTDDSTAFIAAGASGAKTILVPQGTTVLNTLVPIVAGQTWMMQGVTVFTTSSTQTIFSADTVDDWALIGPFTISGNGSTVGTAKGVFVTGCKRWRIENYTAKTIKGWGLLVQPGTPSGTLLADKGHVIAPKMNQCWVGAEFTAGTGAEYANLVAPMIVGCNTGLIATAGNINVSGGNVNESGDIGVLVQGGSNSAHGIIYGVNINHNTNYNIKCTQAVNGQTFSACHIYSSPGNIWLDRCKGIVLADCVIDGCSIFNDSDGSSGYNFIQNAYCPGSDITITDNGSGKDQLIVLGAYGPGAYTSGVSINDPAPVYVLATRDAASTQAVTSGVAATLIFPTEQANGDRRNAYNTGTGTFTVPTAQAGQYRVSANCLFNGIGMSSIASFIELKINGTARYLYLPSIFSTTDLNIQVEGDFYLNAADTVILSGTITGTNPTFGRTTYASCFEIERIG